MKWIKLILVMITPGSPWIMKWLATREAAKQLGNAVPDTASIDSTAHPNPSRIYYFHAPYCGPCHTMMPMIDELRKEFPNLIKVDVTEHPQVATAFGVSATPAFIVIKQNTVSEVKIGTRRAQWLRQRLQDETKEAGTASHSL